MDFPQPFGKYELLRRIATGGMAEVFLARSFGVAGFEKRLVIKRIRPEFAADPRFVSMFVNEAKIGVHLAHPNVVQVYDLGKTGNTLYIAMEHLHGRDLTRLVKTLRANDERIPVPEAVRITAEVCRGLGFAHTRTDASGQSFGLVHRDVSPHNVLVTFTGEVKLVDFGIARLMNTAEGQEQNAEGRPGGGKYAYMSPEQANGEPIDHRTDIFSTGIVLWELIAGRRLYLHPDPAKKLELVQQAHIPHPSEFGSDIDDALWAILQKALARDPDDRYESAALFDEDLSAWLFERDTRVNRGDIASLMRDAFPGEADASPEDIDLRRMVADVERLHDSTSVTGLTSPTPTQGVLLGPQGERKRVAVVMIDLDGVTELSVRLDPEQLLKRRYQMLRWFRRIVDRYEGVIQQAVDDHILLLFGVPRTRIDDLDRALECALELERRIDELQDKGLVLQLAMGVHTGEVTLSPARKRARLRYTPRGNTTRLARRLSAAADHHQIIVSDEVLQATEGAFHFKSGPVIRNRGGRAPWRSYELVRRRPGLRVAGTGSWVRRENELEVIRDALMELAKGHGSIVALRGGVGMGKSRFVREIRELARGRSIPFYAGRASAFAVDAAREPIRELLRAILGIEPDLPASAVLDQIGRLAQLGVGRRELDALRAAFGADHDDPPSSRETWRAMERVFTGLAQDVAVIVAISDLHALPKADQEAACKAMLATIRRPALFLTTLRGELPPLLADAAIDVELGPFSPERQRRLVQGLLEADHVSDEIYALIARTCEGNPLYLQEMIKYLLQSQQIVMAGGRAELVDSPGDTMPMSLAALITARIDALDAASKGVLQLAATVGTTFSAPLVIEAAGVDDGTPLITDLASNGLIVPASGRGNWAFASDLIREAALRGVLGVQRRDHHRLVSEAIERLHADDLAPYIEALTHHCFEGNRFVAAARYAFRAGEVAERAQYLERARELYHQGLNALDKADAKPDTWDARTQGEAMLHYRLGAVYLLLGETGIGENHLQIALDISADSQLPWIEVRAHLELGRSYTHRGRPHLASAHIEQARAMVRNENDPDLELETLEAAADLAHEAGRNEEAQALWSEALAKAAHNPTFRAKAQIGLANRHVRLGNSELAAPLLESALEAARASEDRILEGRVLNNIGLLHSWGDRQKEALSYYRKALEVREGIGYTRGVVINHHNIGDVHFNMGAWSRAHVAFERSRELAVDMGWERGVVLNDVYLGYIDAKQGRGLERIEQAADRAREIGDVEIATTGSWLIGRYLVEEGRREEAVTRLTQAREEAEKWDLRLMSQAIDELLVTAE